MKILVFGSRSLTAKHLPAMRWHMLAAVLHRFDEQCSPIPLNWINQGLGHMVPDDARFREGPLSLIHGDGPPGKAKSAIGADKLATVAALLAWPQGWRCSARPPEPMPGETWGAAALRRNQAMVDMRPDFSLCFHTDPDLGRGSADTARKLKAAGLGFRLVLLSQAGAVLKTEER